MSRVLIHSADYIGESMAGPAIRYWEFAKNLSQEHDVILFCPNATKLKAEGFQIKRFQSHLRGSDLDGFDVLITQNIHPKTAMALRNKKIKIILDAYDPIPLEALEQYSDKPANYRESVNSYLIEQQKLSFMMADSVICASEKQRDLWIGLLMNIGKINHSIYEKDNSLRSLIDVVPFGVQKSPPIKTSPGLKEKFSLKKSDKVILWGGGIWNWLDPLSPIHAISEISKTRDDIKLVFMGLKHPNENIMEMEMSKKALKLATDLGIKDKHVFFNYGWVPYDERQNYLIDATAGISTHFDHLETRFSFRTRILDYLWASLPTIATEGDAFAGIISANELGEVVAYNDTKSIYKAIIAICDNKALHAKYSKNARHFSQTFQWDKNLSPLRRMILSGNHPSNKTSVIFEMIPRHYYRAIRIRTAGISARIKNKFSRAK